MTARTKAASILALAASVAVLLAVAGGGAASGAGQATASAEAFKRSGSDGESGRIRVEGNGTRVGKGTTARASTSGGRGTAEATATVAAVNIFGGLVTAASAQVSASATGAGTTVGGRVEGLAIKGEPVGSAGSSASYDLAGYGTLEVLASDATGITALRATLTKPYKGHPAGSSMSVAFARAIAGDAAPGEPGATPPGKPGATEPDAAPARPRGSGRRRAAGTPRAENGASRRDEGPPGSRPGRRRRAPDLTALPTGRGYAFPVYGRGYGFTNDWGAPRPDTGSHEGTDVFAPAGTPVVAVTRGVLYRVGTRRVPGNRMWLKSPDGDTFFFGHLSAFAHDARNGAHVKPGDVIGFVGSTGDAEQTPPHLHFEIHPGDGAAVNPYPFLRAWEQRRDVPQAAWLARYGNDPGSRPGALVVLRDFLER